MDYTRLGTSGLKVSRIALGTMGFGDGTVPFWSWALPWEGFVSIQDQYSLVQRGEEQEMFPLLADQGIGSLPWSPLAAGVLARPWSQNNTRRGKDNPQTDF